VTGERFLEFLDSAREKIEPTIAENEEYVNWEAIIKQREEAEISNRQQQARETRLNSIIHYCKVQPWMLKLR